MSVEMDLYGGKGANNGGNSGGEGGYSRIRFTMDKNVEYIIAGLTDSVQSPYIYRKATLIANVGKGGDAGERGRGGFGGGVSNPGENAPGRDGGQTRTSPVTSNNAEFGSLTSLPTGIGGNPNRLYRKATTPNAGMVAPCSVGIYWRDQGVSACDDVEAGPTEGVTYRPPALDSPLRFRWSDGDVVSGTGWINRGYKAGLNYIQTAGKKETSSSGNGGNGAKGGQGGSNGYGGAGGGGYTDGSVTVVSTQQGGGDDADARVILRVVT